MTTDMFTPGGLATTSAHKRVWWMKVYNMGGRVVSLINGKSNWTLTWRTADPVLTPTYKYYAIIRDELENKWRKRAREYLSCSYGCGCSQSTVINYCINCHNRNVWKVHHAYTMHMHGKSSQKCSNFRFILFQINIDPIKQVTYLFI